MDKSVFSYDSYKNYLLDRIKQEPKAGRGVRQKLAAATDCQVAYVSHVLAGDRDFNIEQAEAITRFFSMTSDESEYFIWLLQKERAGTIKAKEFFEKLLQKKRDQYLQLKNRVQISEELDEESKGIYYSDYLYAAVHMMVTIPKFQTAQEISEHLKISKTKASKILEFLKAKGLVSENQGRLIPTSKYIFLDKDSPFINQHHTHWRLKALEDIRESSSNSVHLSLVVTVSEKDAKLLQRRISEFIEEISDTIKKSPEEKLMSLGIDFFSV